MVGNSAVLVRQHPWHGLGDYYCTQVTIFIGSVCFADHRGANRKAHCLCFGLKTRTQIEVPRWRCMIRGQTEVDHFHDDEGIMCTLGTTFVAFAASALSLSMIFVGRRA